MVGTITTDLAVIKAAEVTTDYLVLGTFGTAIALNDDIRVEGTNAINGRVSGSTAWALASTPSANLNLSGTAHVFAWIKNLTWPSTDTLANGGIGLSISSDATPTLTGTTPSNGPTNSKTWYLAGSNTDSTTGWVCYVVDPNGTANLTLGTPVMSSVDRIGLRAKVTGTVTNKTLNIQFDVSRYGSGLTIVDGTGLLPAGFIDLYTTDTSSTNAWGIITFQTGIYFLAGKINVGTTGQTAETVFVDINQTLVYQNFPVASTFYEIIVTGGASEKTTFRLGDYTANSGLVSNGVTIKGAGNTAGATHAIWTLTSSDTNQVTRLYDSSFSEMRSAALAYNTVSINVASSTTTINTTTVTTSGSFTTSGIVVGMSVTGTGIAANTYVTAIASATSLTISVAATASGTVTLTFAHSNEIRGCTFNNFGTITTNGCLIDSSIFRNLKTTAPISAVHALILASPTEQARITNSSFINCNRALRLGAAGTYTFDNLTFSGNIYDVDNFANGTNAVTQTDTRNTDQALGNGTIIAVGESFVGNGAQIANVVFTLSKTGTPTGTATAKIYAHSGTFGTSSVPTGTALATSQTLDVATLTGSPVATTLYFITASNNITLTNAVNYVVTLEYSGGNVSNYVNVGVDTTAPTFGGNFSTYNGSTWTAASGTDAIFLVRTGGIITVNAINDSNPSQAKVINTGTPPGSTTISNAVNLEINGVSEGAVCYIVVTGGGDTVGTVLMNELANASGVATESYNYPGSTVNVTIRARYLGYLPFESSGTITANGLTVTAVWQLDPNILVQVTGINITFTNPTTITRASGDFGLDGWDVPGYVTVTGSTSNNGKYQLSAVGTTTLTITGATLTNEGPASGITLTWSRT